MRQWINHRLKCQFLQYNQNVSASINSNRGEMKVSIDLSSGYHFETDEGFHGTVSISAQEWDGEDHDLPINLKLDGFRLSRSRVVEMVSQLSTWCKMPLEEMKASPLLARFELCRLPGQSVLLEFGPRSDTIDERKPVLSFAAKMGRVSMETHFVTDQSCLAMFADEAAHAMRCLSG